MSSAFTSILSLYNALLWVPLTRKAGGGGGKLLVGWIGGGALMTPGNLRNAPQMRYKLFITDFPGERADAFEVDCGWYNWNIKEMSFLYRYTRAFRPRNMLALALSYCTLQVTCINGISILQFRSQNDFMNCAFILLCLVTLVVEHVVCAISVNDSIAWGLCVLMYSVCLSVSLCLSLCLPSLIILSIFYRFKTLTYTHQSFHIAILIRSNV